jgi:hypothetical protein
MKKKKFDQHISTKLGTIVLIIIALTVGVFVWKAGEDQEAIRSSMLNQQDNTNTLDKSNNKYSNADYGFSLNLPYALNKYIIQISPNTIARVSFSLPATNQKFIEYTGHTTVDALNILVYPKSEIDLIRKECWNNTSKYLDFECSSLKNEQPLAENNMYSFYYLKGGLNLGAYPQTLDDKEYADSEIAARGMRAFHWSLNFNPTAWHVFTDNKYGYEIEYPNDWRGGSSDSPNAYKQDLVGVFSASGPIDENTNGGLLFGKYSIYNNGLTDSVDGNVKFLNSKVNIIGSNSTFKEIRIKGGRAFYNTVQNTPLPNERSMFIVGKNVIFNGNFRTSSKNMNSPDLDYIINVLSHFKFH